MYKYVTNRTYQGGSMEALAGLFLLGFAIALLWGAIKSLIGCLARVCILGLGVLFLVEGLHLLS